MTDLDALHHALGLRPNEEIELDTTPLIRARPAPPPEIGVCPVCGWAVGNLTGHVALAHPDVVLLKPGSRDPYRWMFEDCDERPPRRVIWPGWDRDPPSRGVTVTLVALGWCLGVLSLTAWLILGLALDPTPRSSADPTVIPSSSVDVRPSTAGPSPSMADASGPPMSEAPEATPNTLPSASATAAPSTPAPRPTDAGWATWCAPTPTQCQNWGHGRLLGAVHSFRWGDEPYRVRVSRGERSVTVTVVSFCACENRPDKIDLSVAAFSRLAPLPLGRIDVEVEVLR